MTYLTTNGKFNSSYTAFFHVMEDLSCTISILLSQIYTITEVLLALLAVRFTPCYSRIRNCRKYAGSSCARCLFNHQKNFKFCIGVTNCIQETGWNLFNISIFEKFWVSVVTIFCNLFVKLLTSWKMTKM